MVGDVSLSVTDGLVVRTTLDPAGQPFLADHRIDGTPVLPGVMGMEAFAEAAAILAPAGYRAGAVEQVSFLSPVKFFRDDPRTVTVTARVEPDAESTDLLARCTLSAERLLPGHDEPVRTTHFTGTVRLVTDDPGGAPDLESTEPIVTESTSSPMRSDEVYSFYFHGPAYQVVGRGWRDGGRAVAQFAESLPADRVPHDAPLVTAPRLAELCFQTAGLWEAGTEDRMALPSRVESLRLLQDVASVDGPLYGLARPVGPSTFDCAVVDGLGTVVLRMDGYQSVALPSLLPDPVLESLHITFASPDRAE
jgi:hypothetical protein